MRPVSLPLFVTAVALAVPPSSFAQPKPGETVWAQWRPNAWYHGKIEKKTNVGFHINYDDGDQADVSASLLALDKEVKKDALKPGTRVIVPGDGTVSQLATVLKVDDDKVSCRYEDLSENTVELKDVRQVNSGRPA